MGGVRCVLCIGRRDMCKNYLHGRRRSQAVSTPTGSNSMILVYFMKLSPLLSWAYVHCKHMLVRPTYFKLHMCVLPMHIFIK